MFLILFLSLANFFILLQPYVRIQLCEGNQEIESQMGIVPLRISPAL